MAGGSGTRMKSEVPKQFLHLEGKPIIVQSIQKFIDYQHDISIVVVLPEAHVQQWEDIKLQYFSEANFGLAIGGATRTASVISGLALVDDGLVAIHDAVRPFVTADTIAASFDSAERNGSGVAVVQLKDSIREIDGDTSAARDRSNYVLVQTPQTFRVSALKDAYEQVGNKPFSDDASVFEVAGNDVHLVEGGYSNIKITTPEDLN